MRNAKNKKDIYLGTIQHSSGIAAIHLQEKNSKVFKISYQNQLRIISVKNLKRKIGIFRLKSLILETRTLHDPIIYNRMKMRSNKINSKLRLEMLWLILSRQEAAKDGARKRKGKWEKGRLSCYFLC